MTSQAGPFSFTLTSLTELASTEFTFVDRYASPATVRPSGGFQLYQAGVGLTAVFDATSSRAVTLFCRASLGNAANP